VLHGAVAPGSSQQQAHACQLGCQDQVTLQLSNPLAVADIMYAFMLAVFIPLMLAMFLRCYLHIDDAICTALRLCTQRCTAAETLRALRGH
jgi:hypothetical protein